jgi:hypothetical protein
MFSLITMVAAFGGLATASQRWGVDSRRDERNW